MENEPAPPRRPPLDTIAELVKFQRGMLRWKQETLAAMAKVSLSTIERVERAQKVRDSSLNAIAAALNHPPGAFTDVRTPLPEGEVFRRVVDQLTQFVGKIAVPVARFRTELQLRALAATHLCTVDSDVDGTKDELGEIREWVDLTAFVLAQDGGFMPARERSFRMRTLYQDLFAAVASLEKRYKGVCLVGTYEAQCDLPGWEKFPVGVIAFRSREANPAAEKISQLLLDDRIDAASVQAALAVDA